MRRILATSLLVVIATALAYFGWQWWSHGRFMESTDNAFIQADISIISPKISGYVTEVRVADNHVVQKGDLLVVIGSDELAHRVSELAAVVEANRAAVQSTDQRIEFQKAMVSQAQAAIATAEADRDKADNDLKRAKNLAQSGVGSRQALDDAEAGNRRAAAGMLRVHAALNAEQQQLGVVTAGRAEAVAKLRQAQAQMAQAQLDLDNAIIRAPIEGIAGNVSVRDGQFVRPGTQLMALVPLDRVYVVANFKETQISLMRVGQPVQISIDAFPGVKIVGRLDSLAPASGAQFSLLPPENATGNFTKVVQRIPVRIALPSDSELLGKLRPGMSVTVAIDTRAPGETDNAVPTAARPDPPKQ